MATSTTTNLTITRVDTAVFNGEVVSVTVPGSEGVMTILAHHAPLVSLLKEGTIVIHTADGTPESITVKSGVLEVSSNQITILL